MQKKNLKIKETQYQFINTLSFRDKLFYISKKLLIITVLRNELFDKNLF